MNDIFDELGIPDDEDHFAGPSLEDFSTEDLEVELAKRRAREKQSSFHKAIVTPELRRYIENGRQHKDGVTCPACDQLARNQKRRFNVNMANAMSFLVREFLRTETWVDVPRKAPRSVLKSGGDWSVARHWGLCVPCGEVPVEKKSSGLWKPTEKCIRFVRGEVTIPSHVVLYNRSFLWHEGEQIAFTDVLTAFNYPEFMSDAGNQSARVDPG